jgi:hypothetical protein
MLRAIFVALLLSVTHEQAKCGPIEFHVAPSWKAPFFSGGGRTYRDRDQPPDPTEIAVTIRVEHNARLAHIVQQIRIDSPALPSGVHWVESQGGIYGDGAEMTHFFQIRRARPFSLRRQDFTGLPDRLRLPKLLLKPRGPNDPAPTPPPERLPRVDLTSTDFQTPPLARATQRPNQAMQLTAPRSVSPLSVATTLNSQPRALSGAVADLVSR